MATKKPGGESPAAPEGERTRKALFWGLLVVTMALIFLYSAMDADESSQQSGRIVTLLEGLVTRLWPQRAGDEKLLHALTLLVRKGAHFCEFGVLGLWAVILAGLYGRRLPYLLGGAFASFYAATDEFHQLFVPGREGRVRDWLIDTSGVAFFALLLWLSRERREKRKKA